MTSRYKSKRLREVRIYLNEILKYNGQEGRLKFGFPTNEGFCECNPVENESPIKTSGKIGDLGYYFFTSSGQIKLSANHLRFKKGSMEVLVC